MTAPADTASPDANRFAAAFGQLGPHDAAELTEMFAAFEQPAVAHLALCDIRTGGFSWGNLRELTAAAARAAATVAELRADEAEVLAALAADAAAARVPLEPAALTERARALCERPGRAGR